MTDFLPACRTCTGFPCPRSCEWGAYGPWSACSKTCGGGTRTRTRSVARRAEPGGGNCEGQAQEVQFCATDSCPDATTGREARIHIAQLMYTNSMHSRQQN